MNDEKRQLKFFFTPVGFAVFVISVLGLIRALYVRNAYEIVIFCFMLLLLLGLGIVGAWKSNKLKTMEPAWKTPSPFTASSGEPTQVSGLAASIPLFFRIHFNITGTFHPCGINNLKKKSMKVRGLFSAFSAHSASFALNTNTSIPRGETSSPIALDFPMSGIFHGDGYCRLRDIFGFFSFAAGIVQHRTVNVRWAPCHWEKSRINAQTGAEDQRNKPAADIERYYMREYTPGDRLRDINWKSSEKIDMLITRISTDNQERISRLEIHFRNFAQADASSFEAGWLLDRAKSRLAYFLRSLMEQNSSYIFDVRAAEKNWEIENTEELETFFEELASVSFAPSKNETATASGAGDMYVFSTACDFGLPAFLLANSQRAINLFLIQPPLSPSASSASSAVDTEYLKLRDFYEMGITPPRGLNKKVKPLHVNTNKTEIFYAGVKL